MHQHRLGVSAGAGEQKSRGAHTLVYLVSLFQAGMSPGCMNAHIIDALVNAISKTKDMPLFPYPVFQRHRNLLHTNHQNFTRDNFGPQAQYKLDGV